MANIVFLRKLVMYLQFALAFDATCCLSLAYSQQPAAVTPMPPAMLSAGFGQERAYCTLWGKVTTANGTALPGATVQIMMSSATRETIADAGGSFVIRNLPPGVFPVTVSLNGFTSVAGSVRLTPDANTATAIFALVPAVTDSVNVSASTRDIAAAQVQLEEQQRVAGILPNFFVSYIWRATPLTAKQKFGLTFKNATDPGNLPLVGTVAGVQQAANSFPGYGQGWKGYGRRYGADLGNLVSGTFLGGAILPSIFRQDPRYF